MWNIWKVFALALILLAFWFIVDKAMNYSEQAAIFTLIGMVISIGLVSGIKLGNNSNQNNTNRTNVVH